MNRFKLTVSLISFCCIFLLACTTQVMAAPSNIMISSATTQPTLQQLAVNKLSTNPNLHLSQLNVVISKDKIELNGFARTGFERALAQKFLENTQGIKIIENKIKIKATQ
ncbi:MAG: BON domain-containing protein [Pseudoalteromonas sp.]|uniref:BON domain-containing protein n=1 Tax=unclassified Pseudoalteromonas TaxID=194690 RepID=UPI000C083445|nr:MULTISPECIES: BON domain-containing protein [unclassified Pseudoalteromonas]MDP2636070.1 BON domain-containing protein [Pseudoalteromonas sp. 1_MG-2023]PHN90611.1 BON domain-containing protein [Pseudoalteromonas sp. 3D05]TGE85461.1 BON domain-containing protein [Pseudoalteromonas sp. KS88]